MECVGRGQIPGEATRGLSVMWAEVSRAGRFKGRRVWEEMSLQTRRALLHHMIPQYCKRIVCQEEKQAT